MKRAGGLAGLVALFLLAGAPDAHATVVKDSAFTVDLRGANICFISPAALRSPEHCEDIEVPEAAAMENVAKKAKSTFLATGYLRNPENGLLIGLVQVVHKGGSNVWPDQKAADDFARGFAKELPGAIPGGKAKARVSDTRIVHNGDTRVVRTTIDLDGLEPGSDHAAALEHQEVATVFTRDGSYTVVFGGSRENEAALRAISVESVPTIRLAEAAQPHEGKDVSGLVGRLVVYLLVPLVVVIVYFSRKRTQANREAIWRQQQAYLQQQAYQQHLYAQQQQQQQAYQQQGAAPQAQGSCRPPPS